MFFVNSSKSTAETDDGADDQTKPLEDTNDGGQNGDGSKLEDPDPNKSNDPPTIYMSDATLFGGAQSAGVHQSSSIPEDDHKDHKSEDVEDPESESADISKEKWRRRHLCEGETFHSFGIEWRVMECVPSNGFVDSNTKVTFDGKPLSDCKKVTLRPIYESVPFSHRNFTPKQYKTEYLDSWSRGASRYIDHSREVRILGVDFAIRDSEPSAGLVTMQTVIDYMGMAIKLEQLQAIRAMEDEEMARKLKQQMQQEQERKMARQRAHQRRARAATRGGGGVSVESTGSAAETQEEGSGHAIGGEAAHLRVWREYGSGSMQDLLGVL